MKESQTKLTFVPNAYVSCLADLPVCAYSPAQWTCTYCLYILAQVMLVGPRGPLVFVVVLVGRMALLWPPENAMVPHSTAVEREPTQETAPVLLVSNE